MRGIAFEFANLERGLINVREQSTSSLAVETDRGNKAVMFFDLFRPVFGFVFNPIIPLFGRWITGELTCSCKLPTGICQVFWQDGIWFGFFGGFLCFIFLHNSF